MDGVKFSQLVEVMIAGLGEAVDAARAPQLGLTTFHAMPSL
jgi:hypothetical protein